MKPPPDLPSTLVVLGEAFARRAGIDPGDFWDYVYRRTPPPSEIRAAIVEALFPRVRPDDFLLTPRQENATIATMTASDILSPRTGRPPARRKHPLIAAMRKHGVTLAELGTEVQRSRASVQSWCLPKSDPSHRPIPKAIAEHLRDRYGVPLATWSRIAD